VNLLLRYAKGQARNLKRDRRSKTRANRSLGILNAISRRLLRIPLLVSLIPGAKVLEVVQVEESLAHSTTRLTERTPAVSSAIQVWGAPAQAPDTFDYPEIYVRSFTEALVTSNPRFAALVLADKLVIPRSLEPMPREIWKGTDAGIQGGILAQRENQVLVHLGQVKRTYRDALYIGTRSPMVWGHWVVNYLASLHVANLAGGEAAGLPLLVPESVMTSAIHRETLDLFSAGRELLTLKENVFEKFDTIVWVDAPVTDTPLSQDRAKRLPIAASLPLMRDFSTTARKLASAQPPKKMAGRRIFVARKSTHGRHYNQEELIRSAQRFGFEAVWPDDYSFVEQVRIFSSAEAIVGPLGSGLTGVLFCSPGTKILAWSTVLLKTENFLANLARVAESEMWHLVVPGTGSSAEFSGDYVLNPEFFERTLTEFIGPASSS
jgi:hypothetical protein